jgi:hypothetical protein
VSAANNIRILGEIIIEDAYVPSGINKKIKSWE